LKDYFGKGGGTEMKRRKLSQAEKQYGKIIRSLDKTRSMLEYFCSSQPHLEEEPREELFQAINELDELSYRIYSLRFELRESGVFEEDENAEKAETP